MTNTTTNADSDQCAFARVARKLRDMPTSDGAGVKLTRVIGTPQLDMLDPFLMLDEFGTDQPEDYLAGFPEHPHRGFETVTYMLDGRMRHFVLFRGGALPPRDDLAHGLRSIRNCASGASPRASDNNVRRRSPTICCLGSLPVCRRKA